MMILLVSMSFGSGSINYGQATTAPHPVPPAVPFLGTMCIRFFREISGVFINKFPYTYDSNRGPLSGCSTRVCNDLSPWIRAAD